MKVTSQNTVIPPIKKLGYGDSVGGGVNGGYSDGDGITVIQLDKKQKVASHKIHRPLMRVPSNLSDEERMIVGDLPI